MEYYENRLLNVRDEGVNMHNEVDESIEYNNELSIPDEEKELNLFRAMYYQLNAKPDSMSKVFPKQFILSREDIIELNDRVKDKIRMHCQEHDGYIATITVSLSNRKIINFKYWEEFIAYQWNENAHIKSIILKWNFNVRMPQYKYPQNHALMVKISSGLRPEEMLNLIFSGQIEDFEEIETNTFPVAARVDFIEPLLGEELLNVVAKWVDGMPRSSSQKNPFLMFLRKYRKKVAYYFNYVAFFLLLALSTAIVNRILGSFDVQQFSKISIDQFRYLMNWIVLLAIILVVALKILDRIAQKVYNKLEEYGNNFIFNITKGDRTKQTEIYNNAKENAKAIIFNLVASIVFNVLCSVISAFII